MSNDYSFQSILESAGYRTRSYSGRCMFGKSCLGVVVKGNIGKLVADVIDDLDNIVDEDKDNGNDSFRLVANAFRYMSTDSMGLDTIVYFKDTPFVDDEEYDENDEADKAME